jgi:hypothetical protein
VLNSTSQELASLRAQRTHELETINKGKRMGRDQFLCLIFRWFEKTVRFFISRDCGTDEMTLAENLRDIVTNQPSAGSSMEANVSQRSQ